MHSHDKHQNIRNAKKEKKLFADNCEIHLVCNKCELQGVKTI